MALALPPLAPYEEPVLAADGERTDAALGHVVVEPGIGILQVVRQVGRQAVEVVQSLREVRFRQQSSGQKALLDHPRQFIEDRLFDLPANA